MRQSSRSRRAQLVGHVFVFLIGAFVMAAVALLGWRAVSTLGEQQCAAQEVTFTKNLQEAFSTNLARGKTRTLPFTLPCNADQVCFVSRTVIDDVATGASNLDIASISANYPAIGSSIESGEQTNVFVRRNNVYEPVSAFGVPAPVGTLENGITCIDGEDTEIQFQGTGPTVIVKKP